MKVKTLFFTVYILLLFGCSTNDASALVEVNDEQGVNDESVLEINRSLGYNELVATIDTELLNIAVERPDEQGALGRNKNGYFHVRFQLGMTSISDFAIAFRRIDALESFMTTMAYSFEHQLEEGDFELNIPDAILNLPDFTTPGDDDLASGTAFFASSLGISILSLSRSEWFLQSPETTPFRSQLLEFDHQIEELLDYLITQQIVLRDYDRTAPNRLIFDALAYFTLGTYLNRQDAVNISQDFLNEALALTDGVEGYFLENGGWDSSYNGVALQLGIELLSLMEFNNTSILENVLLSASEWQITRISESGEISTQGNTRVFPGGESFLGEEKGVDYPKTVRTLLYLSGLTGDSELTSLAQRVFDYYTLR